MDQSPNTEMRQRITDLIEEAGSLLEMIPRLLDENEQMRVGLGRFQQETDHLRGEIEQMRVGLGRSQQEADHLRGEIVQLKHELAQERIEREMCTNAMNEASSVINEMLVKLRVGQRSSSTVRDPGMALADLTPRPGPVASSSF